ncbi:peptidyl-prolyl cis-trans isomerase FKBP35 [Leptinotarsa decemlineata]|uniref:peptidyl-prolyl cis-trans isomerase FKBP35 n=1 Tax=Leptinotarsa decemlineata TaxID=7539 RepID=UPI003D3092F7
MAGIWTNRNNPTSIRTMRKEIMRSGVWGNKPSEGSFCTITITNSPLLEEYTNSVTVLGDNDGELWRALDFCLSTMNVGEKSLFSLDLNGSTISLVIELTKLDFKGFIFQWSASEKYTLSVHHKEKGNCFFKSNNTKEAAFRYSKALKIICSIPIDVEQTPNEVDGVPISNISSLKSILYNNLASCYLRVENWGRVYDLSNKVLEYDSCNIKALYKMGVACEKERDFEKAYKILTNVSQMDPGNKACNEHLSIIKEEIRNENIKVNIMTKRMFSK